MVARSWQGTACRLLPSSDSSSIRARQMRDGILAVGEVRTLAELKAPELAIHAMHAKMCNSDISREVCRTPTHLPGHGSYYGVCGNFSLPVTISAQTRQSPGSTQIEAFPGEHPPNGPLDRLSWGTNVIDAGLFERLYCLALSNSAKVISLKPSR